MVQRQRSLAVDVVDELRREALEAAGQFLGTKKELQERFAVSGGTLNEAMRILQLRGLVELRPGPRGGVFSKAPSGALRLAELVLNFHGDPEIMHEAMEVRDALEPALWLEVAEVRRDDDLRRLDGALQDMVEAMPDPLAYLRANWDFHRAAAMSSRNSLFRTVYISMVDLMASALDEVKRSGRGLQRTSDNVHVHEQLIDAVRAQDAKKVLEAVAAHAAGGRTKESSAVKRSTLERRTAASP